LFSWRNGSKPHGGGVNNRNEQHPKYSNHDLPGKLLDERNDNQQDADGKTDRKALPVELPPNPGAATRAADGSPAANLPDPPGNEAVPADRTAS
jgi:hypothetical protein